MANAPATATTGGSVVRAWTELRVLGGRAVATRAAHATIGVTSELVVVQRFPVDAAARADEATRDARALLALRHPNVARVRDVFERDGELVTVTQFVEGETLSALRRAAEAKGRPIPLAIELRILVDLLSGVSAIHGVREGLTAPKPLGIVHGEVAPTNVVVGADGVSRVVQLAGVHLAQPGSAGETLGYVAPEILLADDGVDVRADVYGAGVILWEALSGQTLFTESSAGAIVTRHLSGRIRRATVPSDAAWAEPLVDVAHKALATDPSGRHASASELASEIKRVAKTNLASAAKVAAFVKELGQDAIAERRKALAPFGRGAAKPAPSPPSPPIAKRPVPPKPAPAAAPPTTKPIPEQEIAILTEDFEESAVKPRALDAPPEPSVHDRVTSPSPLLITDVTAPDAPAAKPAFSPETTGEIESAILEAIVDSDPSPAPVAVVARAEVREAAPERVPTPAPLPPAAFSPAIAPVITPAPERASGEHASSLQPVERVATPMPSPLLAPLGSDAPDDASPEGGRKRRRALVFAVVAAAALVLVLAIVKSSLRTSRDAPDANAAPAKVEAPDQRAAVAPTPSAPAEPTPTEPAAAEPTAAEPTAAEPTPTKPVEAPTAAEPAAAPKAPVASPGPAAKPKPKPKTSSTYDPLGI